MVQSRKEKNEGKYKITFSIFTEMSPMKMQADLSWCPLGMEQETKC